MSRTKRSTYFLIAVIAALGGIIMKLLSERENEGAFLPGSDGDSGAAPFCEVARLQRVHRFHCASGVLSAIAAINLAIFAGLRKKDRDQ